MINSITKKYLNIMKRNIVSLLIAFVALLSTTVATAQTINSSYFMEGSYFRTNMNPALTPNSNYVAIPALSGVGVELNSNFLSVDNFFFKKDGQVVTALHSSVSSEEFLDRLPNYEKMTFGTNLNILGVGLYKKNMFWNFGINVRVQGDLALTKDFFTVLKTFGNGTHDLDKSALSANAYSEAYVGTTYPILKWLTVGARVKLLFGLMNATASLNEVSASVNPDSIHGNILGTVRMNAPVIAMDNVKPNDTLVFKDIFNMGAIKLGSMGAAIDLGTEMKFLNNTLRVSAAVTDLGFIRWSRKTTAVADLNGKFHFNGIDFTTGDADYGMESDMVVSEASKKGYTTMLNCSLNVGAEYNILNNRIGFGLLSHTEFCTNVAYSELTLSANFRPLDWLSATLSHTFLTRTKIGVFGFALNIHCTGLNFFLGADYIDTRYVKYKSISVPRVANSLNAYMGIGFNFGKRISK